MIFEVATEGFSALFIAVVLVIDVFVRACSVENARVEIGKRRRCHLFKHQIVRADTRALMQDQRALHDVVELANVARPVMLHESRTGGGVEHRW